MLRVPALAARRAFRRPSLVVIIVVTIVLAARPLGVRAQALVPPRVVSIEEVELPDHEESTVDAIEVVVVITVDGAARVESCAHAAPICDAVSDAITRSRFEPATRDGAPIPARIGVLLRAHRAQPVVAASVDARDAAAVAVVPRVALQEPPAEAPPPQEPPQFRAVARVGDEVTAGARRLALEATRDVPGTMGDPLRVLESLPGVVSVASGLPFVFVRGSPPAGTLYVYDGIPLPQLFHLALGPSVIHPRMLGAMQLHAGAAPARWGRHIGGVILAEGPDDHAPLEGAHGEAELRILDVSGFVQAPVAGGTVAAATRFGWPGLIASSIEPSLALGFGDYQLRATIPIGSGTHAQLVGLGSYDRLAYSISDETVSTELQFHRLEGRIVRREGTLQLLGALRFGWDRSTYAQDLLLPIAVETGQVAPRVAARVRESIFTVNVGADAIASFGRNPDLTLWTWDGPLAQELRRAIGRSVASAWVDLEMRLDPSVTLDLGARLDVWITGNHVEGAFDPRMKLTVRPLPELTLHVGAGVTRQPPTYYFPVPATRELVLAPGLQTAMQSDVGVAVQHEWLRAEVQLFLHRYEDLVFSDLYALAYGSLLCDPARDVGELCLNFGFDPTTNGLSWGGELLVAVAPSEPISGWLSYTLAWAEIDPIHGLPIRPSYDVRHVLNLVMRWELGGGFSMGGRIHVRSGAPRGFNFLDFSNFALGRREAELPAFFRGDASVAYRWDAGWARLRVAFEWLNLTISEEAVRLDCETDPNGVPTACRPGYAPPIFAPNLGLRMEL